MGLLSRIPSCLQPFNCAVGTGSPSGNGVILCLLVAWAVSCDDGSLVFLPKGRRRSGHSSKAQRLSRCDLSHIIPSEKRHTVQARMKSRDLGRLSPS
ncbi:Uncharacterized protein HZ326_6950 [Fusarium oxysporum f. sp. albedinis]|nr:Uncharacterized protein HZ326_6950 [Fusarium oxysporum f. sp. albedinis]